MPVTLVRNLGNGGVQIANPLHRIRPELPAERLNLPRYTTWIDGVFEGGGALGTAYVGSLRALGENGIWFKRVAGNSAGAIIAVLVAAGYSSADIQWLSSNFPECGRRPATLPNSLTAPIDFTTFLDAPRRARDFPAATRRATLLWRLLKGQILDSFLAMKLPVRTCS